MEELKKRLLKELQQSLDVKVLSEQEWAFTMHHLQVDYTTVTKTKMDVFMKMLLLSLQQLPVQKPEELAELLGVEVLFVEDLLASMRSAGLVEKMEIWSVTERGKAQLESGMLIYEAEEADSVLSYSPIHQSFFDIAETYESFANVESFRYEDSSIDFKPDDLPTHKIEQQLSTQTVQNNTEERQKVIERISNIREIEEQKIICIEYHLHNRKQDTIFARVWNTYTEQWDETLEQLVMAKERAAWRTIYLSEQEELHET